MGWPILLGVGVGVVALAGFAGWGWEGFSLVVAEEVGGVDW